MLKKLYPSDVYYNQGESAKKVADFINSLMLWENDACQLVISPATANVALATANAGTTVAVKVTLMSSEATPTPITFAEFTLKASIAETTISDSSLVPTINTEAPVLVEGTYTLTVTIPKPATGKTYVAGETITVTIASYTAKDGRSISGGTCVLTIV